MSTLERRVQQLTPLYRATYPEGLPACDTLAWVGDHAPDLSDADRHTAAAMLLGMTDEQFSAAMGTGAPYDATMDVLKLLGVLLLSVTVVYWAVELLYKVLV